MAEKIYDIVIVGGGPGGLCAGMYAARARRKVVCIERFLTGGQISLTGDVEDYPGFEHIQGPELGKKFTDHAKKFGLEIAQDEVTEVYVDGDERVVVCASGDVYRAKAVIVSTGGTPVKLDVVGEVEYSGKGVSYCAICDGAFFKDKVIAVVGGGDAAIEEGTFLTKYGSKIYIIHRRDKLRAQKIIQQRAFDNKKIEFIWNSAVDSIHGTNGTISSLTLRSTVDDKTSKLDVGAIFIYIGFHPNTKIFRDKVKTDANGYIITNDKMETSISGIYACGDVRAQLVRQVTNAVGDGTTAAVAAEKYIEVLEDKVHQRV